MNDINTDKYEKIDINNLCNGTMLFNEISNKIKQTINYKVFTTHNNHHEDIHCDHINHINSM